MPDQVPAEFFRKFLSCNPEFARVNFFEMTEPTLLVLAAGMGSRYGGLNKSTPSAPTAKPSLIIPFTTRCAPGFRKVVFVIRRDIEGRSRKSSARGSRRKLPWNMFSRNSIQIASRISRPAQSNKALGNRPARILMAADVIRGAICRHQRRRFLWREFFSRAGESI